MKKYIVTLFLLFIYICIYAQNGPPFEIHGHRGARGLMPENTIPALLKAAEIGVTAIEIDVAITADKKVVLSHEPWISGAICLDSNDNTIYRSKEKNFNIYKLTYSQIQMFDCGTKPQDEFSEQQHLPVYKPLLVDAVKAVDQFLGERNLPPVRFNIEIKANPEWDNIYHPSVPDFCTITLNELKALGILDRCIIQSFDARVLQWFKTQAIQVPLSFLVDNKKNAAENIELLGFTPQIYSVNFKHLDREQVDWCHKQGIKVIPWTVNEIEDMLKVKSWGVDGFITDYPNKAIQFKQ